MFSTTETSEGPKQSHCGCSELQRLYGGGDPEEGTEDQRNSTDQSCHGTVGGGNKACRETGEATQEARGPGASQAQRTELMNWGQVCMKVFLVDQM